MRGQHARLDLRSGGVDMHHLQASRRHGLGAEPWSSDAALSSLSDRWVKRPWGV